MLQRYRKYVTRILSVVLAFSLMITEASAIVKEVYVGGAYSANDLGNSDNRITMEELKEDFSPFKSTDWLNEYFHKDKSDVDKVNSTEALAWLIDNEVITRDIQIIISNIATNTVPHIRLTKLDEIDIYNKHVNRSDFLMYLYRAIYGPIDARTVGVETPNIRVDNALKNTLYNIMVSHSYFTLPLNDGSSISQTVGAGSSGSGGSGGSGTTGGSGSAGGSGGSVWNSVSTTVNDLTQWRYTPQGDEYESIFGDTNIFVSDVNIAQSVVGGGGGAAGGGGAGVGGGGGAGSGGTGGANTSIDDIYQDQTSVATPSTSFSGMSTGSSGGGGGTAGSRNNGRGGGGGGGGSGGGAAGAIQYETDYKSIYYVPGADLIFYRTNDCLEEYIRAAINKGILGDFTPYATDTFLDQFVNNYKNEHVTGSSVTASTTLPVWDGDNIPRIFNRSMMIQNKMATTRDNTNNISKTLGVNFNVIWNSDTVSSLSISRNNPFSAHTGYFSVETMTKLDVLNAIYTFMQAGEKAMTELEASIINYKYGIDLSNYGDANVTKVLSFLIAKGIINFEDKSELLNLSSSATYMEVLPWLYRAANTDARLNFSQVQLTDSESQWQASGYGQSTLYLIADSADSGTYVESYYSNRYSNDITLADEDSETPYAGAIMTYDETGESIDEFGDVLDTVNFTSSTREDVYTTPLASPTGKMSENGTVSSESSTVRKDLAGLNINPLSAMDIVVGVQQVSDIRGVGVAGLNADFLGATTSIRELYANETTMETRKGNLMEMVQLCVQAMCNDNSFLSGQMIKDFASSLDDAISSLSQGANAVTQWIASYVSWFPVTPIYTFGGSNTYTDMTATNEGGCRALISGFLSRRDQTAGELGAAMLNRLCNNIFVIGMLQDDISSHSMTYSNSTAYAIVDFLNTVKTNSSVTDAHSNHIHIDLTYTLFGRTYSPGAIDFSYENWYLNALAGICAFNAGILEYYTDPQYKFDGLQPYDIRLYMFDGSTLATGGVVGGTASGGIASVDDVALTSAYDRARALGVCLQYIEFSIGRGSNKATYIIERSMDVDVQKGISYDIYDGHMDTLIKQVNETKAAVYLGKSLRGVQITDIKQATDSLKQDLMNNITTDALGRAEQYGAAMEVVVPSGGTAETGFVDWDTIRSARNAAGEPLPIVRVNNSDCVLRNTQTDTYAYFPVPDSEYKFAIVGTSIVEGDPEEGACKAVGGHKYYYWDAIRVLLGVKNTNLALSGMVGIPQVPASITYNTQPIPVEFHTGYNENSIYGLRFELARGIATTDKTIMPAGYSATPDAVANYKNAGIFQDIDSSGNNLTTYTAWGNFAAATTTNRVTNMLYRKFRYKPSTGGTEKYGFIVIYLVEDKSISGSAQVTSDMSMQDILDSVVVEPTDAASLAIYQKNVKLTNAVLNMLYGTQNAEYIMTGYVKPQVYFYAEDEDVLNCDLSTDLSAIPSELQGIFQTCYEVHKLRSIRDGAVSTPAVSSHLPGAIRMNEFGHLGRDTEQYYADYYISDDMNVAVCGTNLYTNVAKLSRMAGVTLYNETRPGKTNDVFLRVASKSIVTKAFSIGSQFYAAGYTSDYIDKAAFGEVGFPTPKFTVLENKTDGTIVAQFGPITGVPAFNAAKMYIFFAGTDPDKTFADIKDGTTYNLLAYAWDKMLRQYRTSTEGSMKLVDSSSELQLSTNPILLSTQRGDASTRSYVAYHTSVGTNKIAAYLNNSAGNTKEAEFNIPSCLNGDTFMNLIRRIENEAKSKLQSSSVAHPGLTEGYFKVEFSGYKYQIRNGQLAKVDASARDTLGPAVFANLNDMIIDGLIDASQGAIPVNTIKAGDMLSIGEGWYCAGGTSEADMYFVGYAPISRSGSIIKRVTKQDAAMSFASQFIRAGQQYCNVSHWFKSFDVLWASHSSDTSLEVGTHQGQLQSVVDNCFAVNGSSQSMRYGVTTAVSGSDGDVYALVPSSLSKTRNWSEVMTRGALFWAPCVIKLDGSLLAYPVSGSTDAVTKYKLCNHANQSVTGDLSALPFYTEEALTAEMVDLTSTIINGGYAWYTGAVDLMEMIHKEFEDAFTGDLFTLTRMLLFYVLVWLFLMSWICYAFHASRLMFLVEAICHPTNDKNKKGVDLFKVFSIGTISVDTDFKLGRFLQYDLIIAILMLVVWKSGNLAF